MNSVVTTVMINLSGVKIWSKAEVKAVADIKAKGEKTSKVTACITAKRSSGFVF